MSDPHISPLIQTLRSRARRRVAGNALLGLIGMLAGGAMCFGDIMAAYWSISTPRMTSGDAWDYVLIGVLSYRILLDGMLMFASLALGQGDRSGRRLITLFTQGELLDAIATLLVLPVFAFTGRFSEGGHVSSYFILGMTLAVFRCIVAAFSRNIAEPLPASAAEPRSMKSIETQPPRFIVKGREIATGQEVEFQTKAKTEALARTAAIALGLDEKTVTVEHILHDEIPDTFFPTDE